MKTRLSQVKHLPNKRKTNYKIKYNMISKTILKFQKKNFLNDTYMKVERNKADEDAYLQYCIEIEGEVFSSTLEIGKVNDKYRIFFYLYDNRDKIESHIDPNYKSLINELTNLNNDSAEIKTQAQFKRILSAFKIECEALVNLASEYEDSLKPQWSPYTDPDTILESYKEMGIWK